MVRPMNGAWMLVNWTLVSDVVVETVAESSLVLVPRWATLVEAKSASRS